MLYTIDIPKDVYRSLNKNAKINPFFSKYIVGECVRLISDYYETTSEPTDKGWEQYYKDVQGWDGLYVAYDALTERLPDLDEMTIKRYIYHRVLGQTWNGFKKELMVIDDLNLAFPEATFKRTSFAIDHDYCIDAEMYFGDTLILGVQIKPESYQMMSTPYQMKAKEGHRAKNERYKEQFATYLYVYYNEDGIKDKPQLMNQINLYLHYANSQASSR